MRKRDKERLIDILIDVGSIDGSHHKQWAIDQALRVLMGKDYETTIGLSYDWDKGVAP